MEIIGGVHWKQPVLLNSISVCSNLQRREVKSHGRFIMQELQRLAKASECFVFAPKRVTGANRLLHLRTISRCFNVRCLWQVCQFYCRNGSRRDRLENVQKNTNFHCISPNQRMVSNSQRTQKCFSYFAETDQCVPSMPKMNIINEMMKCEKSTTIKALNTISCLIGCI